FLTRVVQVKQRRPQHIFAYRPYSMRNHEPPGFRLQGRTTVPDLDEFPRELRLLDQFRLPPNVDVVGESDVVVDAVDPAEHGVLAIDLTRKQGHTFILGNMSVNRHD